MTNASLIEVHAHEGGIRELRLARPPVNALNPALVAELLDAVRTAADEVDALVLSGREGLFSAGLDLPELLALDEDGMRGFWTDFFGLLEALARSPIPIATAITGHSPAGGTVLALFTDYRVQADGDFKLGLNEVQVGLVVPPVIHRALARLIGPYPAERHLVAGRMIGAAEADALGLVDERVAVDRVIERAIEWCRFHLDLPRHSMTATRELVRGDLCAFFDDPTARDTEAFVDFWFREPTQATLKQVVEQLRKPR